jgi:hypothetical protein
MPMYNLQSVLSSIVHNGLTTYKTKNSRFAPAAFVDTSDKKGVVFVVREKEHFADGRVRGYIVTSKETLVKDAPSLSHWTPNVFCYGEYADPARKYIKGFEEKNLSQINTFVVDIDTKDHSINDILLACIDDSIGEPSLIIESPRGFQVYFMLEAPYFMSNKGDYKTLRIAKRISENIKRSLSDVSADLFCNDFGFFRMPTNDNIVWYSDARYTIGELIDWSQRFDDDLGRTLYVVPRKMTSTSLLQSDWFAALLHATDIKGQKGQFGRNNTMFTLALACYQEGVEKGRTYDMLDEFNSNLRYPLNIHDMRAIINSAYCGEYRGPKREYVQALLDTYVHNSGDIKVNLGSTYWYKHKKDRKDRQRSHYDEWEQDIIAYLKDLSVPDEPFVWLTQKELCEALKMPQSTLNEVLKRSKTLLKTVNGRGRYAKTGWTTVSLLWVHIMHVQRQAKAQYNIAIVGLVQSYVAQLAPIGGYEQLRVMLNRRSGPPDVQLSMIRSLDPVG